VVLEKLKPKVYLIRLKVAVAKEIENHADPEENPRDPEENPEDLKDHVNHQDPEILDSNT
jgi:hypothetical protein